MEPRGWAITGVPATSASTTDSPNGLGEVDEVEQRRRAAEQPRQLARADGADVADRLAVHQRRHPLLEVGPVLHHPRDHERQPGALRHGRTLVLPYGCSDRSTRIALVDLDGLLAALLAGSHR
ncbi:hypothetical protein [Serinibacter arcticus]|uniref:hypothetical protein n=1 Tax=Serinibacter arcticus TaxID=1655435 RepID=UPI0018EEA2E4|nr:hypothetical protein [Serinibacter arcticus]